MKKTRRVVVVGGIRIPFCRSGSIYRDVGNFEMLSRSLQALVERFDLKGEVLGDVALGALLKPSTDFNLAREVVQESGLSPRTPAFDLQRACGTSLEATLALANKIALGQIDCGIAGGSDTNSEVPIRLSKEFSRRLVKMQRGRGAGGKLAAWKGFRLKELKPKLPSIAEPRTGLSMGEHCERMAQHWQIPQAEQDALALRSHQTAAAAWDEGFYSDLVVPFLGADRDNNVRGDTTLEKMAKLRPAFERSEKGTLTAANSSPLTDGASCALLASEEWATQRGLPIQAYFVDGQVAAVDYVGGAGLLMAPTMAVAKLLERTGIGLGDFDYYEIHEAFAAQVLATLRAWESDEYCRTELGLGKALGSIDREKMNVVGGSVALGHPFAATGTRIVGNLAKLLANRGAGRGLISICTAGGMGVAAVLEAPQTSSTASQAEDKPAPLESE